MRRRIGLIITGILCSTLAFAQQYRITGLVRMGNDPVGGATIIITPGGNRTISDDNGSFRLAGIEPGNYTVWAIRGYVDTMTVQAKVVDKHIHVDVNFPVADRELRMVTILAQKSELASGKLRDVTGTAINAGKKTEVISLRNINANLATNNTRQIYARVPGLNIWEYDRGGLQLGIGGRGLSPNRSSNFNVRQNGYDISADALGYPESYYNPSAEAVERIEITRGAASLQYGPHFGGLINFVMREGPKDKKIEFITRNTTGSWNFLNTFNSVGGTVLKGKLNYYAFYQYKEGDSWRPNSHYAQHNGYVHLAYDVTNRLKITGEYTLMQYLAKQPGGLTDTMFNRDPSQSVRARNWFKVDWNLVNISVDYALSDRTRLNWRTYTLQGGREALGILQYIDRPDNGGNRDLLSDRYNNIGSELRLIHRYKLIKDHSSTVLVGARYYHGLTVRKQGMASNGSDADFRFIGAEPDRSNYDLNGFNYAGFAENILQVNKHLSFVPGLRVEYIDTRADGYFYKQNIFIAPEKMYETRTSPRSFVLFGIGTSWKFGDGKELYGNISQNYRSINFNDMRVINANARVDPNLKDENGYNADIGFRGTHKGWLYWDMSAFYLRYNDRIGSVFARDSNFMAYRLRTNVSDSRNIGLETMLDGDVIKAITQGRSKYKLNPYASLSLINAKYINTTNTAIAGKLVENVPPVLFRTGISAGTPKWNVTWQYAYQTKQYSEATNAEYTPTAVDGAIPAFSVMDVSLSYNWRMLTLYGGVNNLTNAAYFTRRADGYPGPGILPADRRNFYITLQLRLWAGAQ